MLGTVPSSSSEMNETLSLLSKGSKAAVETDDQTCKQPLYDLGTSLSLDVGREWTLEEKSLKEVSKLSYRKAICSHPLY